MEGRLIFDNLRCSGSNNIHLLLMCVRTCEEDVVQHFISVQSVTSRDLHDALWTAMSHATPPLLQGSFCVDEYDYG